MSYVLIYATFIYYGIIFSQQIITVLSSKSLYYLTVANVVPEKSTFISRIFTYFVPESIYIVLFSFFLISLIQLKKYKSLLFTFNSEKEFNFYKNLLLITFVGIQTISRFMAASLSGIITLMIITYTIL